LKICFFCKAQGPPEASAYQHEMVALAEGLTSLGVPFFSNIDYWRGGPGGSDRLFRAESGVLPEDCDVMVISNPWFDYGGALPGAFLRAKSAVKVYIDASDGLLTRAWEPEFRRFDLILKCHWNDRIKYPGNCAPWAFGLTDRIIGAVSDGADPNDRKRVVLSNFRHYHSVRKFAKEHFYPCLDGVFDIDETTEDIVSGSLSFEDRMQWEQSGRRHDPCYFRRLKESLACAAFGGYFLPSFPRDKTSLIGRIARKATAALQREWRCVYQWDSWRFWESLAAGCCTFHLDFDSYGIRLPEMPVNGGQYIGLSPRSMSAAIERLRDESGWPAKVAQEGKRWALERYAPKPTARRFLALLGSFPKHAPAVDA
jgi:hypothetical protein